MSIHTDSNYNLVIFCSGTGSNLKAIHSSIKSNILLASIEIVIINNKHAPVIDYCIENNIHYMILEWNKEQHSREKYYELIIKILSKINIDLIVLAGWMNICTTNLINTYKNIINIHPALSNTFIGSNCIKQAYDSFQNDNSKNYTGVIIHRVIEDIDKGEVLKTIKVPIYNKDTLLTLETRVKLNEKGILISTIQDFICHKNDNNISIINNTKRKYIGKVRIVEDIDYGCLLLTATDKISAFNKHLTYIQYKGEILNKLSDFWFNNTQHIIPNHFLYSNGRHMVVRKTTPIKLEIIVRAYMTGSSDTSIWTKYNNGYRNMYGYDFHDNYSKNQILDNIIITPTTKGDIDVPITKEEIISHNYLTNDEVDFVYNKALELFKFGQLLADKSNLILVDTKYEFGKLDNNEIILIDELHTCDSSRYWIKDSYENNFNNNLEPDKLDKDAIRDWVKSKCDPYKETIPIIPHDIKNYVSSVYLNFYNMLTKEILTDESFQNSDSDSDNTSDDSDNTSDDSDNTRDDNYNFNSNTYFDTYHKNMVVILGGSISDNNHLNNIKTNLYKLNIYSKIHVCSAHKNTTQLLDILNHYESFKNRNIIYVTCAGMSNALSGVVACNSRYPVFACPPFKDKLDMQVNIHSTLQMPSKVPTMTVLSVGNLALSIERIFNSY